MMTNKELSASIRKDLKDAGFDSKKVHVRVRDSGYSTAVELTIVDPYVKKSDIKDIVNKYKDIRYDEMSQEILMGCNTYVHVQYNMGVFDDVVTPELMKEAEHLFNDVAKEGYNKEIARGDHSVLLMGKEHSARDFVTVSEFELKNGHYGSYITDEERIWSAKTLALRLWQFRNWGTLA